MTVPFVDLQIQTARLRREISAAMENALDASHFILGDQVAMFESAFAEFCGARHCIGVGNGTEALHLALRAAGVGPGDEVITAANTFVATALAISYTGATPVLVDVDPENYLIDPNLVEQAISPRTKVIVPVHLYGQPADMAAITEIAEQHGLAVIADACQAHGALIDGVPIASFGDAACYSFYPSKNLGACGDGGAVVTTCEKLADRVRMLRNYGQQSKNDYKLLGYNSRLDTIQAAILSVKLPHLDRWNDARRAVADEYRELLGNSEFVLPTERPNVQHVYHLYVVQHANRDEVVGRLSQSGIQCGIHYPTPIHDLQPFSNARTVPEGAPVSRKLARRILSLPMYPELEHQQIARVVDAVIATSSRMAVA